MGKCWLFLLLSLCHVNIKGQNTACLKELLATQGLHNAAVGISVKRVNDGKEMIAWNPDMALTPASVIKILPTWFALQEKGENFRYRTPVCYTGKICGDTLAGDLVINAVGDPTPDSRYFSRYSLIRLIRETLKEKGISRIAGSLHVEGNTGTATLPGSWPWEDISNYYGALFMPFNYRDNTYTLFFSTGKAGDRARLVDVVPSLPGIEFTNEVYASTERKDNAWIFGGPYANRLYVAGTIPAGRSVFRVKGAMHNPVAAFLAELKDSLRVDGITIGECDCVDTLKKELAVFVSPPLRDIVFHTCKASVNLFAQALGDLATEGNPKHGIVELLKKTNIDISGVKLYDACGLSPMNAVPASVFTDLLVYIAGREHTAFLQSLPEAGVDGGLAGYCYAFPELKKRMRAKTGSMADVRCLAGYLTASNGEKYAFTVLVNHYSCTVSQLQRAVGKFLAAFLSGGDSSL